MNKIFRGILFIFLFIVMIVELGMRFSIWHSLNETVQEGVEFKMYIYMDKRISIGWCSTDSHENYKAVFYTAWILLRATAASVCQYKSPHIILIVKSDTNADSYHWSFYNMEFVKDNE